VKKLSEYSLVADAIETILSVPRPKTESFDGLGARVLIPPVTMVDGLMLDGSQEFWVPEEIPPDLFSNFNIATAVRRDDLTPGLLVFNWVRTATVKQRRRAKFHSKHMVLVTHAGILDGKWLELDTRLCSFIGGRWIDSIGSVFAPGYRGGASARRADNPAEDDVRIRLAMSFALNARYCYSAVLSDDENNLAARIFAYPDTVRFLLRTRAITNEGRRKALLHLVRRHTRRRKKAHRVTAHLRGEHRCTWAGLSVSVLPSQYDAETTGEGAVKARLEAEGLRRWVAA
jgi:hypothetical protein